MDRRRARERPTVGVMDDDHEAAERALTTVVMTRDRREGLLEVLGRLEGPVIVVDNGSSDGTVAAVVALARPGTTVIALPHNAGAVARNVGVARADTTLVAFSDDDSWWAPGALDLAAELFATHPRLALLAARLLVGEHEDIDPVCEQMAAAPLGSSTDLPGVDVLGFVACGTVVRREAFLDCGGFDPVVFFPGEEERLSLDLAAAGWGLAYVKDVVAHHHPSPGRGDGDGRARLIARNQLLTAVMRRPWPVVVRRAWSTWRAGGARRRAVVDSFGRLPSALVRRRRVPGWVEERAVVLDSDTLGHHSGTLRSPNGVLLNPRLP
jgi:GT2 family glycosyltransferase